MRTDLGGTGTGTECYSHDILLAVADKKGIDPLELTPPLYEAVDPEALDKLLSDSSTIMNIHFEYNGFRVEVQSDFSITISDLTDAD